MTNQERYYGFAGVEIAIEVLGQPMYDRDETLAPFRVEAVRDPYRFTFQKVEALEGPEGELTHQMPGLRIYTQGEKVLRYLGEVEKSWQAACLRCSQEGKRYSVQVGPGFQEPITAKTVLLALETEHLLAQANSFLLHCAYILREGEAVLFTAPSGTGKSTQAELWKSHRGARIINGDRAAIRVTEEGIFAAGIPFSGSSSYCENETWPIGAIVYLCQGPEDRVRLLRGYEAFARIWEGISLNTWRQEDVIRVSDGVRQVSERVPLLHLTCTPGESAVNVLEQALEGREKP